MKVIDAAKPEEEGYLPTSNEWSCGACTFKNKLSSKICAMCEQGRKPAEPELKAQSKQA